MPRSMSRLFQDADRPLDLLPDAVGQVEIEQRLVLRECLRPRAGAPVERRERDPRACVARCEVLRLAERLDRAMLVGLLVAQDAEVLPDARIAGRRLRGGVELSQRVVDLAPRR